MNKYKFTKIAALRSAAIMPAKLNSWSFNRIKTPAALVKTKSIKR